MFKAALMILLYNGYNSIVVFIFYCHCYATITIVYIMQFFSIQRINADKREGVNNFIPERERFSPKLAFLRTLESSSRTALLESFLIYYYYYDNLLLSLSRL